MGGEVFFQKPTHTGLSLCWCSDSESGQLVADFLFGLGASAKGTLASLSLCASAHVSQGGSDMGSAPHIPAPPSPPPLPALGAPAGHFALRLQAPYASSEDARNTCFVALFFTRLGDFKELLRTEPDPCAHPQH